MTEARSSISHRARVVAGLVLLLATIRAAGVACGGSYSSAVTVSLVGAWVVSVLLTDKYVNKYRQRYGSYALASHVKAAVTMSAAAVALTSVAGLVSEGRVALWTAVALFSLADLLVSLVWRPGSSPRAAQVVTASDAPATGGSGVVDKDLSESAESGNAQAVFAAWIRCLGTTEPLANLSATGLPNVLVDDARLNDVRRLNKHLLSIAQRMLKGGYLACKYVPLELAKADVHAKYRGGLGKVALFIQFCWYRAFPKIPYLNKLYFALTGGEDRVFSRTEIWGRLEYCGLKVAKESVKDGKAFILAQKVGEPVKGRIPSYYPIIVLERVGLNGDLIRVHKVRTMFPFAEFLQKKVFELNSFGTTGKIADDFRITGYGRILRKYWLDEIPQLYDWWRGELKLVGLRAVSRHFFGLYPRDLQELFVQVKPGLVPPIFGESTADFDQILETERHYLKSYLANPIMADFRCLIKTATDILVRGVRSH